MTDYIRLGTTVDFYTVLEAAAQRGETAIGYRLMKHKHTFTEHDQIVVLAEN